MGRSGYRAPAQTLTELQQDRPQVATILQNMVDGLLVLDVDERIELSNPVAQRVLHTATLTNHRLVEVVRDAELIELARADAGKLDLELEPCDPMELLEDAVDRARPYAERLGRDMRLEYELDAGMTVEVDARRIGQVLSNLLDNAVKFSPPGGLIDVGARACEAGVEFWVADNAVGLRADQLVRVFEPFYKTDQSRSGSGTGLGLAICKHLVQAHGGSIWAASAGEGLGTVFRFTLPRLAEPPRSSAGAGLTDTRDKVH